MAKKYTIIVSILMILFLIIINNAYFVQASELTIGSINQQYYTSFNKLDFTCKSGNSFSPFNTNKSILLRSDNYDLNLVIEITNLSDEGFDLTHYNQKSSNANRFYEVTNPSSTYYIKQINGDFNDYKAYCVTPNANIWISFSKTELKIDEIIDLLYEIIHRSFSSSILIFS